MWKVLGTGRVSFGCENAGDGGRGDLSGSAAYGGCRDAGGHGQGGTGHGCVELPVACAAFDRASGRIEFQAPNQIVSSRTIH